ncbi:MAG: hypothetical protein IH934_00375 [Nanoarchaeota archaeon]|nr:hypothetical protein [Nanoarchaeota archaeon]
MIQLQPLMHVERTIIDKGTFTVQLDIPYGSTLTQPEIERIMAMSSWQIDPNKNIDDYEGGRGVKFQRDNPIDKRGLELAALYISGIGYRPMTIEEKLGYVEKDALLLPPCKENFMDHVVYDGAMMSAHYENGVIIESKPEFRALGTYTASELETKVANTALVSGLPLSNARVPHIEAYGRYLDTSLSDENGNYGFIVFPIPQVRIKRADEVIQHSLLQHISTSNQISSIDFMNITHPFMSSAIRGLLDVHKNGVVHLQPHLGNFYVVGIPEQKMNMPYFLDWHTMRTLGNDFMDNILNVGVDLDALIHSFHILFAKFFTEVTQEERRKFEEVTKTSFIGLYTKLLKA